MAGRDIADGAIGVLQEFVNMAELTDPAGLSEWLVGRGLLAARTTAEPEDLRHAIALREALRGLIGAEPRGRAYPVDLATLNEAAGASRLRVRFGSDGRARLEPEAAGVTGALGRIVAATFVAMDGRDWSRLKLCASPTCRRAFFDRSRNRSSRWCAMASCGNRAKARRFREQHTAHP